MALLDRFPFGKSQSREQDRRQKGRIRCDGAECDLGAVVDLSAAGARLVHRGFAKPVGRVMTLRFTHPIGPMPFTVKVVRSKTLGFLRQELGLEFLDMTPTHSAWLQQVASYALDRRSVALPNAGSPEA